MNVSIFQNDIVFSLPYRTQAWEECWSTAAKYASLSPMHVRATAPDWAIFHVIIWSDPSLTQEQESSAYLASAIIQLTRNNTRY